MNIALDIEPNWWNQKLFDHINACELNLTTKAEADILVKQPEFITPADLESGKKIIALEKTDGANIIYKHILKHPSVIRYVKQYNFISSEHHNLPCTDERLFTRWLPTERNVDFTCPKVAIDNEDYKKITLGWNFLHMPWMQSLVMRDPEIGPGEDRPLDVFFAGTLEYSSNPNRKSGYAITAHRKNCIEKLRSIKKAEVVIVPGKLLGQHIYIEALYNTKIIVSPWGWGEACFRDYEALLTGCVLIKPLTNYVQSSCKIFEKPCCLWVKPDFSDLPEQITYALARWETSKQQRMMNREAMVKNFYNLPLLVKSIFDGLKV